MRLEGTPSDELPRVTATGQTPVLYILNSFSAREPAGRDAEYIAWHSRDHRPEQYRLPGLRHSMRLVSTAACRARRAARDARYDAVDHVMTYFFTDEGQIPGFVELGHALHEGGRMPLLLPSIGHVVGDLAGKCAGPDAVVGADVVPWRPATGVYILIEEGLASPEPLAGIPGVAGIWWIDGRPSPQPFSGDSSGQRISYLFLDEDPLDVAALLSPAVRERWTGNQVRGLLAAPFFAVVPFEWDRYLP